MVDLSKVSQAVQKFVGDVMKQEENRRTIDTDNEFNQIGNYLANNRGAMNADEVGYIEGLMVEYQNAKNDAQVTDYTKDFARDMARLMGDKKTVDTEAEARELLRFLNSEDLKPADQAYLTKVIVDSGYEDILVDRIGALEARADKSDAVDAALARGLYDNTVHDMQQDMQIAAGAEVDNAQNQALADIQAHDAKQDDLIAEGIAHDVAQDAAIAEGQRHDIVQDVAIAEGQVHDIVQDDAITAGQRHDTLQDVAIVEGMVHDMVQDDELADNEAHDHVQDIRLSQGERRDRRQDRQITRAQEDIDDHESSWVGHGVRSLLEP